MRIRRPKPPEASFRRKWEAPPQATKLLTYSLITGIVFMALLAVVFLPRMFPDQSPVAIVNLRLNTTAGIRLDVTSVTIALGVEKFRAVLSRDDVTIATLDAGLSGSGAALRFVDANGNGLLDAGDYFELTIPATGCFRFEIFQVDVDRRVGFQRWGSCPAT